MGSDVFTCRKVIYESSFDAEAKEIYGDERRADEALQAVEFTLAREPTSHATRVFAGPPEVYCLKTRGSAVWPPVAIYYTCTDQTVSMLKIRRSSPSPDDE